MTMFDGFQRRNRPRLIVMTPGWHETYFSWDGAGGGGGGPEQTAQTWPGPWHLAQIRVRHESLEFPRVRLPDTVIIKITSHRPVAQNASEVIRNLERTSPWWGRQVGQWGGGDQGRAGGEGSFLRFLGTWWRWSNLFRSNKSRLAGAQFTGWVTAAADGAGIIGVVGIVNGLGETEGPAPLKGLLLLIVVVWDAVVDCCGWFVTSDGGSLGPAGRWKKYNLGI